MTLLKIEDPASGKPLRPVPDSRFTKLPIWALGFRPFYLLAASFAALAIPMWMGRYLGWPGMASWFPALGLPWHVHEMVFGFALAVIIGFVFTAGRNWTGLWTPRHGHLAALALLWLAGRLAMLLAPEALAAPIDLAFLPCAIWPIYQVLKKSNNQRNMFLVLLLSLITLMNILFHATMLGWLAFSPVIAVQGAILMIVMIESVIGGRVIPNFTANSVPGSNPVVLPKVDKVMLAVVASASISWFLGLPAWVVVPLAFAAAALQLQRLSGWKSLRTLNQPLLWILHLSYAWIPFGFLLLGLAAWKIIPVSAAFHALTVGSMAGLIIGMMTRTSLGHTGRRLSAGRAELCMYLLIQTAAITRFLGTLNIGAAREIALIVAAICWSASFLLFIVVYAPYLFRPRLDGKEG